MMHMTWLKTLIVLLFFLSVPLNTFSKVFLVSVGISDYPGSDNDLVLPDNDARAITWLYSKNSEVSYVQLLNENATLEKVKAAMGKVFPMAGADDMVVLFFSGHGYQGGFYVYDGYLGYKDVRNAMSKSKCKNKIIYADACFSGKIRNTGSNPNSALNSAKKANVMLFLSSRSNEYSLEYPNMKNGLFTSALQRGLRGGADANNDRLVTARELFDFVHEKVVFESEGAQHPVMWGKFSDDMVLMNWKK